MSTPTLDAIMFPDAPPVPVRHRGATSTKRAPKTATAKAPSRWRSRTGAGQAWNPDNVITYWIEVGLLFAAVAAAGVGSIDGLLHYAAYLVDAPWKQWVLPVAVDVFLVGCALATLSLRRRRAWLAVWLTTAVTLALVAFSAYCNYTYMLSVTDVSADPAAASAPWAKATMPVLLLAATEIVAALTSTRNNREASPLNTAKRKLRDERAKNAELRKALRAKNPEASA